MSCDTAFVRIKRPAIDVFEFMADPEKLSIWSFGTWSIATDETELVTGLSIKDGSKIFLRIKAHEELFLIDYFLGKTPEELSPRIFARIIPGSFIDHKGSETALLLTALRSGDMDADRWNDLTAAHAFEVRLIKSAIESGYDHRTKI